MLWRCKCGERGHDKSSLYVTHLGYWHNKKLLLSSSLPPSAYNLDPDPRSQTEQLERS